MSRCCLLALALLACRPGPETDTTDTFDPTRIEAVCGDGVVEGAEVCDDGNTDDADFCAGDCRSAGEITVYNGQILGRWVTDQPQAFVLEGGDAVAQPIDEGAPRLGHLGDGCGIDTAGRIVIPGEGATTVLGAGQVDCAVHAAGACGMTASGNVTCEDEDAVVPNAGYVDVAVGNVNGCGVTRGGYLVCWGARSDRIVPESAAYSSVEGGRKPEMCGVAAGALWCSDEIGLPGNDFVAALAGDGVRCGLHVTGLLECLVDEVDVIDLDGVVDAALYNRLLCMVTNQGAVDCRRIPSAL